MSQNLTNYQDALAVFRSVADRMPTNSWDNASCCSDWSARQVAGHATWVIQNIAASVEGGDPPPQQPEADVVGDDPAATINASADLLLAALDGADLSAVVATPFGEMPADAFLGIIFVDTLAHAWDVADAGAIDPGISDDLATRAHAATMPIADAVRGFGGFGPAQPEPDGDPVGAWIAFTGRTSVNA